MTVAVSDDTLTGIRYTTLKDATPRTRSSEIRTATGDFRHPGWDGCRFEIGECRGRPSPCEFFGVTIPLIM